METITIDGSVSGVIYRNELNGWTVFTVEAADDGGDGYEITCTAETSGVNEGEAVRVMGRYTEHPVYGRQFSCATVEKRLPTSKEGLVKYLASGVVKGVREKIASKIVGKFGDDTMRVLEESPERLAEVPGITPERARSIGASFQEHAVRRNAVLFLQQLDISPLFANRIYDKYKETTIERVRQNPYVLADDIDGIGFLMADRIAAKAGLAKESPFRVKSGIRFVLNDASSDGHCYLPQSQLIDKAARLLDAEAELIAQSLRELRVERHIFTEKDHENDDFSVYLSSYYYMEGYVAKKLADLCETFVTDEFAVFERVAAVEAETGMELAAEQKRAVMDAMSSGVLVVTGGPGTGKTTTIKTIIKLFKGDGRAVRLAAPTGRAAKRMTEATGMEAETIHRMLGAGKTAAGADFRASMFQKNEEDPLDADVIIIDESSMVDLPIMYNLLKATPVGTRLILVGDADQLPSVGAGNVLKDVINSGVIPVARLTEIFRQARESAIVMNAHRINRGEYPTINEKGKDFFFVKRYVQQDAINAVVDLAVNRLPSYVGETGDIQVLSPMRKGPLGVNALNPLLQNALNPPSPSKAERETRSGVLRAGDKVMQTRNNYDADWFTTDEAGRKTAEGKGVFNGDMGFVVGIDPVAQKLSVKFDDGRFITYDFAGIDELDLAYAVTIHKSQGSEYRAVVIPIHSGPPMLMSRNLLYTAITRAKSLAVIVGIPDVMNRMVDNDREVARYTALADKLRRVKGLSGETLYEEFS